MKTVKVRGASSVILNLDVQNNIELLLRPSVNYANPLQRELGIYHFEFGKDKHTMIHLDVSSYNLQPKQSCDIWNPSVRFQQSANEIVVRDYELMAQQCPDNFDAGCARNIRGPLDSADPYATAEISRYHAAVLQLLRESTSNDVVRLMWFADTDYAALVEQGYYDLSRYTPKKRAQIIAMMSQTDGWWSEIEARTRMGEGEEGRIVYVDTNDGSSTGNAVTAANIYDFLTDLVKKSDPVLRFWNKDQSILDRPCILLQPEMFSKLKKYYQSRNILESMMLEMNGEKVHGMLEFDGYPVIEMGAFDMFDSEMGMFDKATGRSKKQRAIFTVKENLSALLNAGNLQGFGGASLIVQRSPLVQDKGKTVYYGQYGIGTGIAHNKLITVGYNSSTDFK